MARMDDGFPTLLSFSLDSSVQMWEKSVTPPGLDGGDPNDTSTMRNTSLRTMAPRALATSTPITAVVAYDPAVYTEILSMINSNQQITVTFPDNQTYTIWGYIRSFIANESAEGSQPTAVLTIQPTNQNNSGVETAPVLA